MARKKSRFRGMVGRRRRSFKRRKMRKPSVAMRRFRRRIAGDRF